MSINDDQRRQTGEGALRGQRIENRPAEVKRARLVFGTRGELLSGTDLSTHGFVYPSRESPRIGQV